MGVDVPAGPGLSLVSARRPAGVGSGNLLAPVASVAESFRSSWAAQLASLGGAPGGPDPEPLGLANAEIRKQAGAGDAATGEPEPSRAQQAPSPSGLYLSPPPGAKSSLHTSSQAAKARTRKPAVAQSWPDRRAQTAAASTSVQQLPSGPPADMPAAIPSSSGSWRTPAAQPAAALPMAESRGSLPRAASPALAGPVSTASTRAGAPLNGLVFKGMDIPDGNWMSLSPAASVPAQRAVQPAGREEGISTAKASLGDAGASGREESAPNSAISPLSAAGQTEASGAAWDRSQSPALQATGGWAGDSGLPAKTSFALGILAVDPGPVATALPVQPVTEAASGDERAGAMVASPAGDASASCAPEHRPPIMEIHAPRGGLAPAMGAPAGARGDSTHISQAPPPQSVGGAIHVPDAAQQSHPAAAPGPIPSAASELEDAAPRGTQPYLARKPILHGTETSARSLPGAASGGALADAAGVARAVAQTAVAASSPATARSGSAEATQR